MNRLQKYSKNFLHLRSASGFQPQLSSSSLLTKGTSPFSQPHSSLPTHFLASDLQSFRWFSKSTKKSKSKEEKPEKVEKKGTGNVGKAIPLQTGEESTEVESTEQFNSLMAQLEKQMDKTVSQNFKDELMKKQQERKTLNKSKEQVFKDFKETIEKELTEIPTIQVNSLTGWKISEEKNENGEEVTVFRFKDRSSEISVSFPTLIEDEEEESMEGLDNVGGEGAEEGDLKMTGDHVPKEDIGDTELNLSQLPTTHPCNIEITFLDPFEKSKGSLYLQSVIEEDHNIYVQRITPRIAGKFGISFEVMKLSTEFQTSLYELLELNKLNRQLGLAIKQHLTFNRVNQYSAFLKDVTSFLD